MDTQDGNQRRYDYVSQKLRELGRLLLAAKSLNASVQTLQDLLSPDRLALTIAAARKASSYRWTCPPLAMKSTLKTVCEIAIDECVQDGDWDAAAQATDFIQQLVKDWDSLGFPGSAPPAGGPLPPAQGDQGPGPHVKSLSPPVKPVRLKKPVVQTGSETQRPDPGESRPAAGVQTLILTSWTCLSEVVSQSRTEGQASRCPPKSRQSAGGSAASVRRPGSARPHDSDLVFQAPC